MKISVIVPTYKPGDYLWECLDSLRLQTLPNDQFEVVLVLNGCNAPYFDRINNYIQVHSELNIRFVQTDVPGVSNARNIAIERSKGEYITFIDDDDFVSPSYLEELYKVSSPQTVGLCYPLSFVDGENTYTPYSITSDYKDCKFGETISYKQARKYFSGPVYKLIHRSIIANRRFDIRFKNGEDSLFMFLISDRLKNVSFTSKDAIYYRRVRNNSATTKKTNTIQVLKNLTKLALAYTKIFFSRPSKYSLSFYMTRIMGIAHSFIETLHRN